MLTKAIKFNHGEKFLKVLDTIHFDIETLLKKCILVKIILKNLLQKKKLSMSLLAAHCLDCVHLMQKNELSYYRGRDSML